MKCKDCAEYGSEFCPDCDDLEEETNTGAIPDTKQTVQGRPQQYRVHDRRYKGKLRILKRFKEIR